MVSDGMMYVTGPNQVYALDARSGREIWRYTRPRTPAGTIANDAAIGANRGVALLGDRVFFATDNAHMLCLNRLTGALLWDVFMPETAQHYGATSAPLVIGDLVISGSCGRRRWHPRFCRRLESGHRRTRMAILDGPQSRRAGLGNLAGQRRGWPRRRYLAHRHLRSRNRAALLAGRQPVSRHRRHGARRRQSLHQQRPGARSQDRQTRWYFQYTPHDLHDWDAVQPPVLVDAKFHGATASCCCTPIETAIFYVLDRTDGKFLLGKPFVKKLTWSTGLDEKGRPILTPNNETKAGRSEDLSGGARRDQLVFSGIQPPNGTLLRDGGGRCGLYRQAKQGGFGFLNDPKDPGHEVSAGAEYRDGSDCLGDSAVRSARNGNTREFSRLPADWSSTANRAAASRR